MSSNPADTFTYLSAEEIELLQEYLVGYVSLPFGTDIPGEIVEQLVARARKAEYVGKRANRPEPDMIVEENGKQLNYQIKTEKSNDNRVSALSQRGTASEDIITARIDVISDYGHIAPDIDPNELGRMVINSYVENVLVKYDWHRLAILLRYKQNNEFLYFEEEAVHYNPDDFIWERTTTGQRLNKLNIIGYEKDEEGKANKRRKRFKWNIGTTIFYVFHDIPANADYFAIRKKHLDVEAFREFMERQGYPSDEEIHNLLADAIETNEEIHRDFLPGIRVKEANVTVAGEIYPADSRNALLKTIWSTPGVRDVDESGLTLLTKRAAERKLSQTELQFIEEKKE